jgi:5-methylcytosine-specific restriction protein A
MIYDYKTSLTENDFRKSLSKIKLTNNEVNLLKVLYQSPNHKAKGIALQELLNKNHNGGINLTFAGIAKKISKETKVYPTSKRKNGDYRWWSLLAIGEENGDYFSWELRPELIAAIEKENILELPQLREVELNNKLLTEEVEYLDVIYLEGKATKILLNRYERDIKARIKCINHFGITCQVCEFNFEEKFGEIGKDFIHVHHLKEISSIAAEYEVNPIKDLIPVCPNCHAMLHKRNPAFSIEELKMIIKINTSA